MIEFFQILLESPPGGLVMTKVLLVEDEEMSLDMLRRRLVRRGFDVVEAVG